jgi:hypothetical protein
LDIDLTIGFDELSGGGEWSIDMHLAYDGEAFDRALMGQTGDGLQLIA